MAEFDLGLNEREVCIVSVSINKGGNVPFVNKVGPRGQCPSQHDSANKSERIASLNF